MAASAAVTYVKMFCAVLLTDQEPEADESFSLIPEAFIQNILTLLASYDQNVLTESPELKKT